MTCASTRQVVRPVLRLVCIVLPVTALAGCSVAGSWQTVSVEPSGVTFPLHAITFDDDNRYTATWMNDGDRRTTTGGYKWNGRSLELGRDGFNRRTYRARKQVDGTLAIYFENNDTTLTAILERQSEPK